MAIKITQMKLCHLCGEWNNHKLPAEAKTQVIKIGCKECGNVTFQRPHQEDWDGEWPDEVGSDRDLFGDRFY